MKIIIRNEQGIKRCYIQLRDVDYLVERYNSPKLGKMALGNAAFRNLRADDFFEVKNKGVAKIIEDNPYIVEFGEVVNYDVLTLSRMILLSQVPTVSEKDKFDQDHKVEDLQDIISFNKGMLTYPIPVLFDEELLVDDGEVIFGSTTFPNQYMIKSTNPELDLVDYFLDNINDLFLEVFPGEEMKDYSLMKLDDALLIHFVPKRSLFKSLKKRITG